jgi:hypothetical protein
MWSTSATGRLLAKPIPCADSIRWLRWCGSPQLKRWATCSSKCTTWIQHSKVIRRYLPLVKKAAETDEIPLRLYATMLDRQLMFDGKAQVYGTQIRIYNVADPTTQKTETIRVVWPIAHPAGVNRRRKKAGFEETVEENAKQLDTIYRVMTLAEVKKL